MAAKREAVDRHEAWMLAWAAGDLKAFDALWAYYGASLYRFFATSFEEPAVERLLRETLLALHGARGSYRSGSPLRIWLFAWAARIRMQEHRRRHHLPKQAGEEELAALQERTPQREESVQTVRAIFRALPETQRIIVRLHRHEGMTFAEIAAILGTTEYAIRERAERAYATLLSRLSPLLDGETP